MLSHRLLPSVWTSSEEWIQELTLHNQSHQPLSLYILSLWDRHTDRIPTATKQLEAGEMWGKHSSRLGWIHWINYLFLFQSCLLIWPRFPSSTGLCQFFHIFNELIILFPDWYANYAYQSSDWLLMYCCDRTLVRALQKVKHKEVVASWLKIKSSYIYI